MEKLIGFKEYFLQEYAKVNHYYYQEPKVLAKINKYANFLSRPLTLNMFVTCSEDGVILEYNKTAQEVLTDDNNIYRVISKEESAYLTALEKVLFEGWWLRCPNAVTNGNISITFTKSGGIILDKYYSDHTENIGVIETIEDLTKYNLTLTQSAINQLK